MGKSILVIDTPECCERCDLGRKDPHCDIIWCGYLWSGRPISEEGKKPDWCPLHDPPQRAGHPDYCDNGRYDKGWNDCLEQILNGE